ncbi:MAG: L-serine ammonia-lyase, iron-sulfur-dependent, subunit alpha [Oscillospiraceae bacterium]|nr:L-serine ammonia-lyase, iron-sulfur-dependent, subunit alpha [Oscillospiraceae bacterium]
MYKNMAMLLEAAAHKPLPDVVLEDEAALTGRSVEEILAALDERYAVMCDSASRALGGGLATHGNLISGESCRQAAYAAPLAGDYLNRVMARALSCSEVNASMGLICAAPTAGSCGILPAVLIETADRLGNAHDDVLRALALAGGIGGIITRNATVSGAEGGCQAECGTASAMAAAAAVFLAGGAPDMCAEAVSIALSNCMGLICDPVAGLVQLPCSFRNASGAVNAVISADMALAGQRFAIPADEVIEAMYRVGRQLPCELRETSLGGIAATKTGKEIKKQLFSKEGSL